MPTIRAKPKLSEDHKGSPEPRWLSGTQVFEVLDVIPHEHPFDSKTGEKKDDVMGVVGVIECDPALLEQLGLKVE